MKPTYKEIADTPTPPYEGSRQIHDLMDPSGEIDVNLPIDDRPGSERDLNPLELTNCEDETRELIDDELYDSEQAYQIALDSAKDIEKTVRTPRPLNFDGTA